MFHGAIASWLSKSVDIPINMYTHSPSDLGLSILFLLSQRESIYVSFETSFTSVSQWNRIVFVYT